MAQITKKSMTCDACGESASGEMPLETAVYQGVAVVQCLNPVVCRQRAQRQRVYGVTELKPTA